MAVFRDTFRVQTDGFCSIRDLTPAIASIVDKSRIGQGICLVSIKGSTASISTIEYEPGLLKDVPALMDNLIPEGIPYEHDKTWGDGNGFSHLRSFLIKTSLAISFDGGILDLGTWQQVVLVDFDNRPRNREIIVQLTGE